MVTMLAKASTVHRKRLQAPTIATMDLAIGSGAIGLSTDEIAGVSVDFSMLCYRQSEEKSAKAPLIRQVGVIPGNPKSVRNVPALIPGASWRLTVLNP
jgi:hypothetical protein